MAFSTEEQDLHPYNKIKLKRCAVIDARWMGLSTNQYYLYIYFFLENMEMRYLDTSHIGFK